MDSNQVEVKITADASGFSRGAQEASSHVDGLLAHLKEFKSETVSTGREAKFFATQLAEIIPGADGAKTAIRDLIAVGLAGGGIGALVEGAKFLVGVFHELTAEEEKNNEAFTKFLDEQKKSVDALKVSVEKMLMTMAGATRAQILEFEQTHDLVEKKQAKQKDLATATHQLEEAQKLLNEATGEGAIGAGLLVAIQQKEVVAIQNEIKALDELIAKKKATIAPVATADAAAARKEARDQEALDIAKWQAAELAETKKHYDAVTKETLKSITAQDQAEQDHLLRLSKAEYRAAEAVTNFLKGQQEERLKEYLRIQGEMQKKMQEFARVAEKIGATIGNVFQGLADGTLTVEKAFSKMAASIIHELIAMAIIAIKANAGIAGAEAAASVASTPFAGPFLAIAAMSMVEGAVLGLLSLVSSKGGLGTVPYDGTLAMLHKNETVLPADLADRYRQGADSLEGGGGGDVHLNFPNALVVDGASMRKLINDPNFKREFRDVVRRGAL